MGRIMSTPRKSEIKPSCPPRPGPARLALVLASPAVCAAPGMIASETPLACDARVLRAETRLKDAVEAGLSMTSFLPSPTPYPLRPHSTAAPSPPTTTLQLSPSALLLTPNYSADALERGKIETSYGESRLVRLSRLSHFSTTRENQGLRVKENSIFFSSPPPRIRTLGPLKLLSHKKDPGHYARLLLNIDMLSLRNTILQRIGYPCFPSQATQRRATLLNRTKQEP
jgi:hypothetical protein